MKDEERSESTPHNSKAHLRLGKHKRKQRLKVQDIGSLPLPLDCRQGLSHEWQNTSSPSKMVKWQIIFENQISHLYECLESIWPTDVRKWSMTLVIYGPICLFPYNYKAIFQTCRFKYAVPFLVLPPQSRSGTPFFCLDSLFVGISGHMLWRYFHWKSVFSTQSLQYLSWGSCR